MKCHVISCCGSVRHVVIGTPADAAAELVRLRREDFEKDPDWAPLITGETPWERYQRACIWSAREVKITIFSLKELLA